jgi:hypothetical protein
MASQFQLQTGNMKNWVNTSYAIIGGEVMSKCYVDQILI